MFVDKSSGFTTALHALCRQKPPPAAEQHIQLSSVKILLEHGASIGLFWDELGANQTTSLHLCVASGNYEVLLALLEYRASLVKERELCDEQIGNDVDVLYQVNSDGVTALHLAATAGQFECMQALVLATATIKDDLGPQDRSSPSGSRVSSTSSTSVSTTSSRNLSISVPYAGEYTTLHLYVHILMRIISCRGCPEQWYAY